MSLVFTDEMGDEWVTPSFLIKPKGVQATVEFSTTIVNGAPSGLKITNAGSGYDPSDSLSATLASAPGGTTSGNLCDDATKYLPIINADGQISGVDVSQITDCTGHDGALTIGVPPAVNSYDSFWYGAKNMAAALEALPNNVVPAVTVTVECGNDGTASAAGTDPEAYADGNGVYSSADDACGTDLDRDVRFHITFTDNSGDIPALGVRFGNSQVRGMPSTAATFSQSWKFEEDGTNVESRWNCARGATSGDDSGIGGGTAGDDVCTAKTGGFTGFTTDDAALGWVDGLLAIKETVKGTKYNEVCSRRGLCDYSSGECKCFSGFTDVDCSVQNALAMG